MSKEQEKNQGARQIYNFFFYHPLVNLQKWTYCNSLISLHEIQWLCSFHSPVSWWVVDQITD